MPKKILVIDDEKDMRVYLSTLLRKAGYEIESASNGDEGLEKAAIFLPDLITLDVLMPKKSGVKAYTELRTSPSTKEIPIIILTGLAQQEDFFSDELGTIRKPEAIFDKPIERDSFVKRIKEVLGE
ncbi:MAG: response regulator [Deltaproteobacteria bacterium]|nr:response regulator [Deltaproteobacteria bacterium]MBW1870776.1 response regulator [Deltaproteobacteria bacterium]